MGFWFSLSLYTLVGKFILQVQFISILFSSVFNSMLVLDATCLAVTTLYMLQLKSEAVLLLHYVQNNFLRCDAMQGFIIYITDSGQGTAKCEACFGYIYCQDINSLPVSS